MAAAIAAVPFILLGDVGGVGETGRSALQLQSLYESARADARIFLVRNPDLAVDSAGALILDPEWLADMRATAAAAKEQSPTKVDLPQRMLARSQARLDEMIADAYALRKLSDPSWQHGVLDARTPTRNYFAHAFIHPNHAGIALGVAVLLLAGIALELTWGSLIFATFAFAVIPLSAHGYRLLDASGGVPWSGGAGLAGALLGAYFIRGLGGHFTIPGWILLPAWLGVEAFVVRGFWIDDLGGVPWATLCASIGLGALIAGAIRMTNIEAKTASQSTSSGPNPVVSRAARLRSDGDPYQAFDLIQAAWRENNDSEEIAEAFFSIAVEVGQPEAAAGAVVPMLHQALRKGEVARAVDYWFPLAKSECEVELNPTAAVKLGEALLDAGHATEAIFTLRAAMSVGVSPTQAVRIVNVARDLDEALARRAASIALNDATLDPKLRSDLEAIASVPPNASDADASAAESTAVPISQSQLDRRVHAEHQAIETTAFPIESDSEGEILEPPEQGHANEVDANEARLAEQALDTGALSMETLASEGEDTLDIGDAPTSDRDSGDVLSHWNDTGAASGAALSSDPGDLDQDFGFGNGSDAETLLDVSALESHESGFDFGSSRSGTQDLDDPLNAETDTDLTPLMDVTREVSDFTDSTDATDELTGPIDSDGAVTATTQSVQRAQPMAGESTTAVFDQPTAFVDDMPLSRLKALDAVPISVSDEWIEIDASPRGKSKLPFSRIETISMAAVEGLGPRAVLVIDCVLSNSDAGDPGDTKKSVRFRSDRFDPLPFVPGASNPLAALTTWVRTVQTGSNATCLPSRQILEGEFARFDSIERYEREVLTARRIDEA